MVVVGVKSNLTNIVLTTTIMSLENVPLEKSLETEKSANI